MFNAADYYTFTVFFPLKQMKQYVWVIYLFIFTKKEADEQS